jgi:hypothetical protein
MDAQPKPTPKTARQDSVSTIFADGLFGAALISGTVRLDLFIDQFDASAGGMQNVIAGRLILPAERLAAFVRGLAELAQRLQNENQKSQNEKKTSA